MKTYYEIAPQIPIEHKIWAGDGSITDSEHYSIAALSDRIWQHNEAGFVQIKNRTEEWLELKIVPEREQIQLFLSARTLDSKSVKWINDNSIIRVTDPKFFVKRLDYHTWLSCNTRTLKERG